MNENSCNASAPETIEPGYGYRLLATGETIQPCDEFLRLGGWETTILSGRASDTVGWDAGLIGPALIYRRKIKAGEGYRLLAKDELIETGDECLTDEGRWLPSKIVTSMKIPGHYGTYRRKVGPPIDPGQGYRLLKTGELIQDGDEGLLDDLGKWIETIHSTADGMFVGWDRGNGEPPFVYRRKVVAPASKRAIEAGEGYRLLTNSEPIEAGDEFFCPHAKEWSGTCNYPGYIRSPMNELAYRRKVAPAIVAAVTAGDGYRLLAGDEVIAKGDQYYSAVSERWIDSLNVGLPKSDCKFTYRRKVVPPVASAARIAELETENRKLRKVHAAQAAIIRGHDRRSERQVFKDNQSLHETLTATNCVVRARQEEIIRLNDLRAGDFELVRSLAADAGIPITAPNGLPGTQWEQFHDGVIGLRKEVWALRIGNASLQSQCDAGTRAHKALRDKIEALHAKLAAVQEAAR